MGYEDLVSESESDDEESHETPSASKGGSIHHEINHS